jgi:hypothetical protein
MKRSSAPRRSSSGARFPGVAAVPFAELGLANLPARGTRQVVRHNQRLRNLVPGDPTAEMGAKVLQVLVLVRALASKPTVLMIDEMSQGLAPEAEGITREEALERIMFRTRLKRYVDPREVAAAVSYLVGPGGVGGTGTFPDVTGGFE